MDFGGTTAADLPDPDETARHRVLDLGLDVAGLVGQPHLEDTGSLGLVEAWQGADLQTVTVARSYTLWRNPGQPSDPVNLRDVDDGMRAALDAPALAPRPDWLLRRLEQLRHPMLWEAVQTHWTAPGVERAPAPERLVDHVQYVLNNQFREQHALPDHAEQPWVELVDLAAVRDGTVTIDGAERPGCLLDTDPFVVGLAADLDDGRVVTAVLPRDEIDLIVVQFVSTTPLL